VVRSAGRQGRRRRGAGGARRGGTVLVRLRTVLNGSAGERGRCWTAGGKRACLWQGLPAVRGRCWGCIGGGRHNLSYVVGDDGLQHGRDGREGAGGRGDGRLSRDVSSQDGSWVDRGLTRTAWMRLSVTAAMEELILRRDGVCRDQTTSAPKKSLCLRSGLRNVLSRRRNRPQ
jgi:hypothetical protein